MQRTKLWHVRCAFKQQSVRFHDKYNVSWYSLKILCHYFKNFDKLDKLCDRKVWDGRCILMNRTYFICSCLIHQTFKFLSQQHVSLIKLQLNHWSLIFQSCLDSLFFIYCQKMVKTGSPGHFKPCLQSSYLNIWFPEHWSIDWSS